MLGGRAMQIIYNENELGKYVNNIVDAFGDKPILIDKFLNDAVEVDVDALSDGKMFLLQALWNILKKLVFTLEILHALYLLIHLVKI